MRHTKQTRVCTCAHKCTHMHHMHATQPRPVGFVFGGIVAAEHDVLAFAILIRHCTCAQVQTAGEREIVNGGKEFRKANDRMGAHCCCTGWPSGRKLPSTDGTKRKLASTLR